MKRKRYSSGFKTVGNLAIGGLVAGTGINALGSLGTSQAVTDAKTGIGNVASFYPSYGTLGGSLMVLEEIRKLNKYAKK